MPPSHRTLEVSKLSGWLNADTPCAESRTEGIRCVRGELRPGRMREAAGDGSASSVRGRARLQIGAGHGE